MVFHRWVEHGEQLLLHVWERGTLWMCLFTAIFWKAQEFWLRRWW